MHTRSIQDVLVHVHPPPPNRIIEYKWDNDTAAQRTDALPIILNIALASSYLWHMYFVL